MGPLLGTFKLTNTHTHRKCAFLEKVISFFIVDLRILAISAICPCSWCSNDDIMMMITLQCFSAYTPVAKYPLRSGVIVMILYLYTPRLFPTNHLALSAYIKWVGMMGIRAVNHAYIQQPHPTKPGKELSTRRHAILSPGWDIQIGIYGKSATQMTHL